MVSEKVIKYVLEMQGGAEIENNYQNLNGKTLAQSRLNTEKIANKFIGKYIFIYWKW